MLRSFFNAITGMDVSRFSLDVTSDNLANANTVGFKRSRPIFQDMVSQVIVGLNTTTGTLKTTTLGAGAVVDSTQKIWSIGNFKQTDVTTDLAIEGKALFILKDPITNQVLYTRDGRFRLNREGYLINPNGLFLQGFRVDPITGEVLGTQPASIRVDTQIPPKATSELYFIQPTNLNADVQPITADFDPKNPETYHYRYTITLYDSLGTPYEADIFFRKTDKNTWSIHLRADTDGNTDTYEISADWDGIQFDQNGNIVYDGNLVRAEPSPDGTKWYFYLDPTRLNLPQDLPSGGSFPQNTEWRVYVGEAETNIDPGNPIPVSYITQHSADFVVTMDQNGYQRGELIDIYVLSEDGVVVGVYSNGESLPMYRLALAQFTDPEELIKKGSNLYASVKPPTILLAGGANKIRSGMLEMSNVDIAQEFINLITAQRTYQANARTITVANTILEDTINLVR
ncbi:MAG: flagellar hook protein FlgE [Aquificae bacterium]|nr:flagellar hook protein FlgE [Aquificota bacterium]